MSDSQQVTKYISVGPSFDRRVKSKFLYVQEGSVLKTVARFLSDESADYFHDLIKSIMRGEHKLVFERADGTQEVRKAVPEEILAKLEMRSALQRSFDGA